MTDKFNLDFVGYMKFQNLTSLEGDLRGQAQILADGERWEKYNTNNLMKASLSNHKIIKELSHERFPWEE